VGCVCVVLCTRSCRNKHTHTNTIQMSQPLPVCGIVAVSVHAPSHAPLLLPLLLSHICVMGWRLGLSPVTLEFWVRFPNERTCKTPWSFGFDSQTRGTRENSAPSSRMVLSDPGPLFTPPPSSSPPKTPHLSSSAQIRSQNEEKKHPPKVCKVDEHQC
jgi:hypothetical protein